MGKRIGKNTIELTEKPIIKSYASVVGKKEGEGPLKDWFTKIYYDTKAGQDTWEKSENQFQKEAVSLALNKAELHPEDIQMVFAGDLLNQCISSSFGMRDYNIPFLGQYGACSTMAQTMSMGSIMIDSGCAEKVLALTSSHFCTAERQYRFPLEYGGQRTPTAQWTVTGSGCVLLCKRQSEKDKIQVERITIGKMVDFGIKDANNMGAAMAPSAADTLSNFFNDTETNPSDYDAIFTGDLGLVGSNLLYELLDKENIDIRKRHMDCGLMIFDREKQDVHAGGSGCGCSASVLCSYILRMLENQKLRKVLFMATGAMMSPTSCQQGQTIPGISHLLELSLLS